MLDGKYTCLDSLSEPPSEHVIAEKLPPTMQVQLDNSAKNIFVFACWSLLVAKGIFKEVFVSFILVGHTYDDIDASFGQWSMKLHNKDFPTIPLLRKSYMNLDNVSIIPHMIEEAPGFNYTNKSLGCSSPFDCTHKGSTISMLQWIVTKVRCSFCVLGMRHMLNWSRWQELCLNQIL